jgi:hypothetical protein
LYLQYFVTDCLQANVSTISKDDGKNHKKPKTEKYLTLAQFPSNLFCNIFIVTIAGGGRQNVMLTI